MRAHPFLVSAKSLQKLFGLVCWCASPVRWLLYLSQSANTCLDSVTFHRLLPDLLYPSKCWTDYGVLLSIIFETSPVLRYTEGYLDGRKRFNSRRLNLNSDLSLDEITRLT